jgi:ribulose-bisphosphate carboxylase large chain
MAVQLEYLAPEGWSPPNADDDYLITLVKMELADGIDESAFPDAAASCAAESSTGTWTKVYDGPDSGVPKADEMKAVAYDLDLKEHMFKIAYKIDLFEYDNMSGLLAGIVGNISGMKMEAGMRIYDIRFPKKMVQAYPGPAFGIKGVRDFMGISEGPLLCTVPKPKIGRNAQEQAVLARQLFTAAGGNYHGIKDDENLTSLKFNSFEDRCKAVHAVRREVEEATGNKKFFLNNTTHSNMDTMMDRANMIKEEGGRWMMMDVITTGFTGTHSMRLKNPGLAIHAHRAMHGFITRESGPGVLGMGKLQGFSISMIAIAKIMRLLGVDSLHGGSPKAKMEDYGEALHIKNVLQGDETPATDFTLGQKWYGMKSVWHTASGGLHSGTVPRVMEVLGHDLVIQCGGGSLGHPGGIDAGVEAVVEATQVAMRGDNLDEWLKANPDSSLAAAAKHWGFEPKIVY